MLLYNNDILKICTKHKSNELTKILNSRKILNYETHITQNSIDLE